MRRNYLHAVAVTAITAMVGVAPANGEELFTGNYLFQKCQSSEPYESMICMSFLRGVREGMDLQKSLSKAPPIFCVPDAVTLGQTKDIFVKHLRDYPGDRHLTGAMLFAVSMLSAFPCPSGKK